MSKFQQSNADAAAVRPVYKLHRTVALVGMMGAGKTAVGRALAARLDVPFLDSDAEIEVAANMTVQEIFARDGEAFFRQKEAQVIERLLHETPSILSTGGGAFMAEANRQAISADGVSLWLDVDVATLWSRVKSKNTRPLLRTANPRQTLEDLFAARVPVYAKADLSIRITAGSAIETTVDRVIDVLCTRPDVLEVTVDA